MTIDQDDPRLTAYALGELDDVERREVEAALVGHDELLAEVANVREMAALLREGLGRQAPGSLSEDQHRALEQAATAPAPRAEELRQVPVGASARQRVATGWMVAGGAVAALAATTLLFVGRLALSSDEAMTATVSHDEPERGAAPAEEAEPGLLLNAPAPAASMATLGGLGQGPESMAKPSRLDFDGEDTADGNLRGEGYALVADNPFIVVAQDPRSTFSVDVDTASYSMVRRHLRDGRLPPHGAVRIEEMLNYFSYDYPEPTSDVPFSVSTEVSTAPWAPSHQLVRIGVKGRHVSAAERPRVNLVFLLDVSGSMNSPDKLPLLKRGFEMLVNQLDGSDRVSIAVYAGASGLVLPPTPGDRKREILDALERLEAGGSTNGGEGIQLAYAMAQRSFMSGGVNRVILATDGDFNVGTTNQDELTRLVQRQARGGTFLSVLGFGSGNYQDRVLEMLADKGNGNYAYIDGLAEAQKVLVEQAAGTIITIAKDVKIQIEMNPKRVKSFRLIGYENRVLAHQDFDDDAKDAGEIGADHTVTALYELVPQDGDASGRGSMLRYQQPLPTAAADTNELMTIKLRYKPPTGDMSRLITASVPNSATPIARASSDQRFAAAVAAFGMVLRGSEYRGSASYQSVLSLASDCAGQDRHRQEFIGLVRAAQGLSHRR